MAEAIHIKKSKKEGYIMAKITFKQSEVNELFNEEVVVVDGNVRRVTKADILQKTGLPSNFEVEIVADPVIDSDDDY